MKKPFINAEELQPGDIFKTNAFQHKEHWVQKIEVGEMVKITTWGAISFEFSPNKELFLVRSLKMKQEVQNG